MTRFYISVLAACCLSMSVPAMNLMLKPSVEHCPGVSSPPALSLQAPAASNALLNNSQAVQGRNTIAWAWLASPTVRYPHRSLGAFSHAGSAHVLFRNQSGAVVQLNYALPSDRVFEDLLPRLIDLDGDGQDELVLVESSTAAGAALVVLGVAIDKKGQAALQEFARGPNVGTAFRWLNPVGAADFDGDGKLDLAAIITPHIGGVLTLYRYKPPHLNPFASITDVSNHRMGSSEQRLAVIVPPSGQQTRPTVIVPEMGLKALYALRWSPQGWQEIDKVKALPAAINVLLPHPSGACAQLSDGSAWVIELMQ
jgi:FG-GAP-like repeat